MRLYKHLELSHAANIIARANEGLNKYQINKLTGISRGKISRCLDQAKVEITRPQVNIVKMAEIAIHDWLVAPLNHFSKLF